MNNSDKTYFLDTIDDLHEEIHKLNKRCNTLSLCIAASFIFTIAVGMIVMHVLTTPEAVKFYQSTDQVGVRGHFIFKSTPTKQEN